MSNSDVSLFTTIRTQRWHVNSPGTVLSETVHTLQPHTTLSRHQSHHVTDDAGHQQTQLLMLVITGFVQTLKCFFQDFPGLYEPCD